MSRVDNKHYVYQSCLWKADIELHNQHSKCGQGVGASGASHCMSCIAAFAALQRHPIIGLTPLTMCGICPMAVVAVLVSCTSMSALCLSTVNFSRQVASYSSYTRILIHVYVQCQSGVYRSYMVLMWLFLCGELGVRTRCYGCSKIAFDLVQ